MKKLTKEEFIKKSKKIHGDKYDYSKVDYKNSRDKVCIICPIHGEFQQKANEHLRGHGCSKCGGTHKLTQEQFIDKSKEVHGDKYDYNDVVYTNMQTKVKIKCPIHGEFEQLPSLHLKGNGCPKCAGRCSNTEDYINKAKEIHGHKYDYSKVVYNGNNELITIICPIHGEFQQRAVKHLIGHGCQKCGIENRREKQFLNKEEFVDRAKKIHGDKYDYSNVVYTSMRDKVCIICPIHGEFWQYPFDHINEHGCPSCGVIMSKAEEEIYNYLLTFLNKDEIIRNDRKTLNGKEIDLLIPSRNIGIEYNGLKWHSEEYEKDYKYHVEKTKLCLNKGIRLIQIFEDEYIQHPDIVKNKLKHLVGVNDSIKIMARKCIVQEINKETSIDFLNKYHIQGYGKCTKTYGCFYKDILIGVMSFLKYKDNKWELVRFASNYNYICSGIGGKLFQYFIKENNPQEIKTFADRRWTINDNDNLYTKIGFKLDKILKPDYHYIDSTKPTERIHKFNLRKRTLHKKYGLPFNMKESEMVKKIGYVKIWDCGLYRYIWKNEAD